jgi:hypothetical protein
MQQCQIQFIAEKDFFLEHDIFLFFVTEKLQNRKAFSVPYDLNPAAYAMIVFCQN